MEFKVSNFILFFTLVLTLVITFSAAANDPPHDEDSGVTCGSCHGEVLFCSDMDAMDPDELRLMYDEVCLRCHKFTESPFHACNAPLASTHKTAICIDCHHPHYQTPQFWYGRKSYQAAYEIASGTGAVTGNENITVIGDLTVIAYSSISLKSGWTVADLAAKTSDGRGMLFLPNRNSPYDSFMIYSVTDNGNGTGTIKVKGTVASVSGNGFAVAYGQLINRDVSYSTASSEPVLFFDHEGEYSFAHNDTQAGGDDSTPDGICQVCHENTAHWRNDGTMTENHYSGQNCTKACHKHSNGFLHGGSGGTDCGDAVSCHGLQKSHPTHVLPLASGGMLGIDCPDCHDTDSFPDFADGVSYVNYKNATEMTGVCEPCHSADGVSPAKQYFAHPGSSTRTTGSWAVVEGEKSFCGSCHDASPGYNGVNAAPNILGNDADYGFYVTGHGRESGNYEKLSWQDVSATGNPAANLQGCDQCHGIPPLDEEGLPNPPFPPVPEVTPCSFCHDLTSQHFAGPNKRLRAGFENDQANTNCKNCHSSDGSDGTAAMNSPHFYTNSAAYETSAHKDKLCTDCHDVHGASGAFIGMMKENREDLCDNCHSNGGHPGVGSATFTHSSKTYTLECVSCHNVHVVSGTYDQADQNKTPVSKFSDNTNAWGDEAGEKMDDYAGSGTYRTPTGETLTGAQLPDYASFCTDCHSQPGDPPFGINWTNDPHGKNSANQPNGYGTCPNWYTCGKAEGWDGDDCVATDKNDCWPVMTRGLGDQLWSRNAYTHENRINGANFTLSCTDCHTGHGTGTLGRSNVNGGSFSGTWNSMCNNCHYYYSDWHAGMSCGNASCHVSDRMNFSGSTPHEMDNAHSSGATRSFDPDLVLYYKFENNLKDSGTWQMDSKWMDNLAGSFGAGKSGQAVILDGGKNIQVGTENNNWSTDEGAHGTWKYLEMKFNTTLEAWVNPTTEQDYHGIFTKHVGYANGGYEFALQKMDGALRVVFYMLADNNGTDQDGRAGIRGAYSAVAVPLNTWTHVAATFDATGADRDIADPSVGRIRIYVNGEDVTTSDSSGNTMQPGENESSIFAFSENSGWNETGVCYNDSWCASEFSVGGFYDWQQEFVGMIDEARVWNITKDAGYFLSYDSQAGPYISSVLGLIGSDQLMVLFSEGAYANAGRTGDLQTSDFTLTDANGDNPRIITGVTHTAGDSTATITMSQPLTASDLAADTLTFAAADSAYDEYNAPAGTAAAEIGMASTCPTSPVSIQLNESPGSSYIMDSQNVLYGVVNGGAAALTGSEFSGNGDGSGRYIMFDYNTTCLQADTAMTVEARFKPSGLDTVTGDTQYIRRILARDGGGNYQLSVWRNNTWNNSATPSTDTYNAPDREASIALWIYVADNHGGYTWKPVLTNYSGAKTGSENDCPIVSDHWYLVKAAWNTNKPGGTPGQPFTPADIFIDDQGTDGAGTGENWPGYVICTDTDQSLKPDASKFYTGDMIKTADGNFAVGVNRGNTANNLFNGLIDWVTWKDSAD